MDNYDSSTRNSVPNLAELGTDVKVIRNAEQKVDTIKCLAHREKPIHGVQVNPASSATAHGHAMIQTFQDTMLEPV